MNTVNSLNRPGAKKFIPGIAWFFLVLFLLCLPGSKLPSVSKVFDILFLDKWIHIGLFSMLAFLFMYPFIRSSLPFKDRWQYVIRIALATSIWGIATELIQHYFIPGRSFDLFDWAADSLGALIALLIAKFRFLSSK